MPLGPLHDGLRSFFTYTNFTHLKIQWFKNSGPACVLGRAASPWFRPRAPALHRPPSRASPLVFLMLLVFRASSRSPRCSRFASLALSSLSLFLVLFVLALSLSGAPRLQVRRACAPVLGIRKSLICESFRYPLVNLEETKYFGPSRDGLNTPSFDVQYFSLHHFVRSLGFYSFLGGRRKLPQAGEVRRPLGPAW